MNQHFLSNSPPCRRPKFWPQKCSFSCKFHLRSIRMYFWLNLCMTALFSHFSVQVLGVLPRLAKEVYYSVTSVQVFIIHPAGEDHIQPLHRRFLPQQSTFLLISRRHQITAKSASVYIPPLSTRRHSSAFKYTLRSASIHVSPLPSVDACIHPGAFLLFFSVGLLEVLLKLDKGKELRLIHSLQPHAQIWE